MKRLAAILLSLCLTLGCAAAMALLLLTGHPLPALIFAAGALGCWAASILSGR